MKNFKMPNKENLYALLLSGIVLLSLTGCNINKNNKENNSDKEKIENKDNEFTKIIEVYYNGRKENYEKEIAKLTNEDKIIIKEFSEKISKLNSNDENYNMNFISITIDISNYINNEMTEEYDANMRPNVYKIPFNSLSIAGKEEIAKLAESLGCSIKRNFETIDVEIGYRQILVKVILADDEEIPIYKNEPIIEKYKQVKKYTADYNDLITDKTPAKTKRLQK